MRVIQGLVMWASLTGLAVTEVHSAEAPTDWIDSTTGHRVVRLSTDPGTRSLYFHQNSITPDGRFVIAEGTSRHRGHRDRHPQRTS